MLEPPSYAAPSRPAEVPLRRNPHFCLLLGGQLVSALGDQAQNLALPLVVLTVTGSPALAGLVLGLHTAAYLLVGLGAGALVDRWDRRATMIRCELGRAALTATIPAAQLCHVVSGFQLCAVAVLTGVLTTLFQTANTAALPNVVAPRQLPAALGAVQTISSGVGVVGAALAGAVYALGQVVPFAINAVSFLISAATLRRVRVPFQAPDTVRPRRRGELASEIRDGLAWIRQAPVILFLAIVQAADNLRYGAGYLLILLLARRTGATPAEVGLVFGAAALARLLGGAVSGPLVRRFSVGRLAVVMLWLEAVAFPFYAVAPTWPLLAAVAFTESLVAPVYTVAINTYRLAITPDRLRGRLSGTINTLTTGALSLGTMLGGALLSTIPAPTLAVACGGWLVSLAIATTVNRGVRRAPVAAAGAPDGAAPASEH